MPAFSLQFCLVNIWQKTVFLAKILILFKAENQRSNNNNYSQTGKMLFLKIAQLPNRHTRRMLVRTSNLD